ncbi:hypothetical protein BZA70DRAFT_272268 [Myxozyma melibiosi]|uniref:Sterol 3-beta-glucosyltransferase n=1 Tax=Myxozyma melibiosi TaxID=54550 RepID=A0ABR1FD89_9ASCO
MADDSSPAETPAGQKDAPSTQPPASPSSRSRFSVSSLSPARSSSHKSSSGSYKSHASKAANTGRLSVSSLSQHLPRLSSKSGRSSDDATVSEDAIADDDGGNESGDDDDDVPGLMAQTLGVPGGLRTFRERRGRRSGASSHARSSSVDVAQATGLGTSVFSFISAASKARFSRMASGGDDDDHETEEPELDDDDYDDDEEMDDADDEAEGDDLSPADSESNVSITVTDHDTSSAPKERKDKDSSMQGSRNQQPLASSFLMNRASANLRADDDGSRTFPTLEPIKSVGSLTTLTGVKTETSAHEDESLESSASLHSVDSLHSSALAEKLMTVFGYKKKEEVLHEFPCYLLKSILLQGHMFITAKHIAFFAYIPQKTHTTFKSGTLSRKLHSPGRYSRFWCVVKDNVFSYFNSASELYFPVGSIDLRYALSVELSKPNLTLKEAGADPVSFTIVTQTKKYHFRADSFVSAQEWVSSIQQAIFRAQNEGDSVKIVIPSENVLDLEESPFMEFADTIKIKVVDVDGGEMYAIDDYFFTFFHDGEEALKALRENVMPYQQPTGASALAASSDGDDDSDNEKMAASVLLDRHPRESILDTTEQRHDHHRRLSGGHLSHVDSLRSRSPRSTSRLLSLRGRSPDPSSSSLSVDSGVGLPHRNSSPLRVVSKMRNLVHSSSVISLPHPPAEPVSAPASLPPSPAEEVNSSTDTSEDIVDVGSASAQSSPPFDPATGSKAAKKPGNEGWSDWVKKGGRKVQSMIPNVIPNVIPNPSGYVDKVTEMWVGNSKHFDGHGGAMLEGDSMNISKDEATANIEAEKESADRFRAHFALPEDEKLIASFYGYLHRAIPLYGKLYLGSEHFCFRSLLPGTKTKMILPHSDIENVEKKQGFRFGYAGLVVIIHGHEEVFFEFRSSDNRDDCAVTLLRQLDALRNKAPEDDKPESKMTKEEAALMRAQRHSKGKLPPVPTQELIEDGTPVIFESTSPEESMMIAKPAKKLKFVCLTIGSRGDVQPYIALAKGLINEGHDCTIATHDEFKDWVEGYGIGFKSVAGNPAELMRLGVEHGMFTYSFLREAASSFRGWIKELLETSWVACQDADVLIESPSAMAGIHIAEALQIPYFRAFTMPWTRTRAYPHAFAVPDQKMGGSYNYLTYVMFDNVFWKGISGQVNKWRTETLNLGRTNLDKMQAQRVPFLYNFSPTVVPPPLDFPDWIKVTGYWFLDEGGSKYEPDPALVAFMEKARTDGKKLVYVGFGSIVVAQPKELTRAVVESVLQSDVRCILSKGWSDRLNSANAHEPEVPLPPEVFQIKAAPHDWLFPQIDAAVHHGGAGSTGASLRAGLPTVIKPFFGDQFFYAGRVEDLGAGIHLKKLTVRHFAKALWEATHNERIVAKARLVGEHIRAENGVKTAIKTIYRDMEYARSIVQKSESDKDESWYFVEKGSGARHRGSGTKTHAQSEKDKTTKKVMGGSAHASDVAAGDDVN